MSFDTYSRLMKLYKRHGSQEFGRICQILLEMSLQKIGFKTRGRSVERPDISAERSNERYAFEVKAPIGNTVVVTKRDLNGINEFKSSAIVPVLAVLIVEPDTRWVLAKAKNLRARAYSKISLAVHEINPLTKEVNAGFPNVLVEQFDTAYGRGSGGLRERLSKSDLSLV